MTIINRIKVVIAASCFFYLDMLYGYFLGKLSYA